MNHDYLTVTALNQYIHKNLKMIIFGKVYVTVNYQIEKTSGHQYY